MIMARSKPSTPIIGRRVCASARRVSGDETRVRVATLSALRISTFWSRSAFFAASSSNCSFSSSLSFSTWSRASFRCCVRENTRSNRFRSLPTPTPQLIETSQYGPPWNVQGSSVTVAGAYPHRVGMAL